MKMMFKTVLALGCCAVAAASYAVEPFKVSLILPMTGPFASTGKEIEAGVKVYMAEHGDTVKGRKVQVIVKDDGGVHPELTKRLAQELAVNDKVNVLAGFGLTPLAFAAAPIATKAKVPMIVMAASTSSIVRKSPYVVRTSMTEAQVTLPLAEWAAKDTKANIKTVVTLVSDYGPGIDSEKVFVKYYTKAGGKILESIRVPLESPDFSPFLQRVRNLRPDAVFAVLPSGQSLTFMKQFVQQGLRDAGIKLIGTGAVLDDNLLPAMGDEALGVVTSSQYSAAHDSPENKDYVRRFAELTNNSMRPNFFSVAGYDGMHLIYAAVQKAGPSATGDQLLAVMKGMEWMSPRGPISIDPETRDIVQTVYIRRAQKISNEIYNVEFDKNEKVKDPGE
jgi:branched-chain amino acid transport system substrate-binding protein